MVYPLISIASSLIPINPLIQKSPKTPLISTKNPLIQRSQKIPFLSRLRPIDCFLHQNPSPITNKPRRPNTHHPSNPSQQFKIKKNRVYEEERESPQVGSQQMGFLCGLGYWVQGFRCFPWLALNFHMAHNLNLHPSILQLVQSSGNLPMVAKPLYGVLSDAISIGGAHRLPYISIGAFLQVLSWGSLALIPFAGAALPTLMACVLLGNLGASVTEVAMDALVAEYGQRKKMSGLQSYAFMALATGGILGNLLGGFYLLKTGQPRSMFLIFTVLLFVQLAMSMATREDSLGLPQPAEQTLVRKSILESIKKQYTELMVVISEKSVLRPLIWLVASIAMVPVLSGSIFCYQTQSLNLDPWIVGMARVTGQLMLLSTTILYDRFWKSIPLRKVIGIAQILYASSLLLDLVLVKQINLTLGIGNDVFALCFSGVAETIAQFKLLPFQVLFASLAPPGCEGSLMSFLAAALCLSSIFSGFLGVGLASLLGITSGDYSSLPVGIAIQFIAALVPLLWIHQLPSKPPLDEKDRKRGRSRRTRKNRRVGRVVFNIVFSYRRKRESEAQT